MKIEKKLIHFGLKGKDGNDMYYLNLNLKEIGLFGTYRIYDFMVSARTIHFGNFLQQP